MTTALLPRLTALDRRVLASLPGPGERAKRLFDTFKAPTSTRRCDWHNRQYERGYRELCPQCAAALDSIADAYEEHCEILRGLEHIGLARCAGGWWRRV